MQKLPMLTVRESKQVSGKRKRRLVALIRAKTVFLRFSHPYLSGPIECISHPLSIKHHLKMHLLSIRN